MSLDPSDSSGIDAYSRRFVPKIDRPALAISSRNNARFLARLILCHRMLDGKAAKLNDGTLQVSRYRSFKVSQSDLAIESIPKSKG